MPPALSDDEDMFSAEEIPYRAANAKEPEVEDEEGDEEEDEYVVEKIVGHKVQKGIVFYDVKWLNYDDPKDRTWEPEDNLEGAIEVLQEYWEEIGGRPEPKAGVKRKGRKSGVADSAVGTPASSTKRAKKEKEWSPPSGSWENEVDYVETVAENENPQTGEKQRFGYLVWQGNHGKTQHPLHIIYQKCPQKMLQYYESHLVFTPGADDDDINGL